MANPNVGELVATTLRNRKKQVADTVINCNALLRKMSDNGQLREVARGGRTIFEPLIHDTNSSAQFYTNYDTFTPDTNSNVIDGAEYNWKQLGGFVAISGLEMIQNQGNFAAVDLLETRIKQLMSQLKNSASTSLYSDGTGSSSKEFGGLQLLVADSPSASSSVGGINQATYTWWRNYSSGALTLSATTIAAAMNAAWLALNFGPEKPDIWLADSVMYNYYETSLQTIQRITKESTAGLGFPAIEYKGAPVVYDSACTAKHMYALSSDYMAFRYAPNRWFDTGDARQVTTADYEVVPVWTAGNLTTNNRRRQGVIIDD